MKVIQPRWSLRCSRALPKLRPFIRPVYERLGILPAFAAGLQHALLVARRRAKAHT